MRKEQVLGLGLAAAMLVGSVSAVPAKAAEKAAFETNPVPSVTVAENKDFPESDAPYQVTFTYKDDDERDASKVTLNGTFQFYDPAVEAVSAWSKVPGNVLFAHLAEFGGVDCYSYKEGMAPDAWNTSGQAYEMKEVSDEIFEITLPLPAYYYDYSFKVEYANGETVDAADDPQNPAAENPVTNAKVDTKSMVFIGEASKAIEDHEYMFPRADEKTGSFSYITYQAVDGTTQPLGVYLPYGYDEAKTYKTVYVSHGGGGDEVQWLTMGAAPNIADNLIAEGLLDECIIVTMNNTYFEWDFDKIADNFAQCIIPTIEKKYSVSRYRDDRAMAGLSMGSMTTITLLQKHPELFGYSGCLSGGNIIDDIDVEAVKTVKGIYLTAGELDMALMGDTYHTGAGKDITTIGSEEYLADLGISYGCDTKHGLHDWNVWRSGLLTFLKDYAFKERPVMKLSETSAKAPKAVVTYRGTKLTEGTDYTLVYPENSTAVGTHLVKAEMTGDCSGSVVAAYTIAPAKVKGLKLTAAKKKITASWKAVAGEGVTYEVSYKAADADTWTTVNTEDTSVVIKGLSRKTKYQVCVCAVCGELKGEQSAVKSKKTR